MPCGPIYSIENIFADEQYRARGNLLEVVDPRIGPLTIPNAMPRLSETSAQFKHTGRALGADTAGCAGTRWYDRWRADEEVSPKRCQ